MKKGVHGKFLRTVKSLYSNLYASVRTVNGLMKAFLCNISSRQGDVSSLLLFVLLINDFYYITK